MLRLLVAAAAIGFLSAVALANPGAAIPVPRIAAQEAIALAERAFRQSPAPPEDPVGFFVRSVEYTDRGPDGAATGDWAWHVTFVHPVRNDRTLVYRVGADGRAVLIGGTE